MNTESIPVYKMITDISILALIALAVRLIGVGIDHHPVGDEMFHVLAAQTWSSEGTLGIADGFYQRSALFTKFVGLLFTTFGESLVVARLPALVFGIFWTLLLYLWVGRHSGRLAAWIAAVLFCIAPHAIELSLYSRMYTLHGFSFLLGSMVVFSVATHRYTILKNAIFLTIAITCFGLALHLHEITIVGLIALGAAVVLDLLIQNRHYFGSKSFIVGGVVVVMFLTAIAAAILYQYWEIFEPLWRKFTTPAFANRGPDIRYYHKLLTSSYPVLWPLLPVAAIVAIYFNPRIGVFCVTLFIIIFVMHSVAGRKAERYIYYGMPFLFAIWGMALAKILPYFNQLLNDISQSLRTKYLKVRHARRFDIAFKSLFAFVGIVFIVSGSDAFVRTIHILNGESYYFGVKLANWEKTVPRLKPLIESAPVVLTTNFPKTLYYFNRFDIAFSPVIVADILKGNEGAIDPRTGRPGISTVDSLQQLFEKYPHGVFVGESSEWRNRLRMTNAAADLLEQRAARVELPVDSRIVAYTW